MTRLRMDVDENTYSHFAVKKLMAILMALFAIVLSVIGLTDIVSLRVGMVVGSIMFFTLGSVFLYLEGLENLITKARPQARD